MPRLERAGDGELFRALHEMRNDASRREETRGVFIGFRSVHELLEGTKEYTTETQRRRGEGGGGNLRG
jgi:hypothetical protein